jgi:hypothetical protein
MADELGRAEYAWYWRDRLVCALCESPLHYEFGRWWHVRGKRLVRGCAKAHPGL